MLKETCNSACDYIKETNQQIPQLEEDVICGFKILDGISLKNIKL